MTVAIVSRYEPSLTIAHLACTNSSFSANPRSVTLRTHFKGSTLDPGASHGMMDGH